MPNSPLLRNVSYQVSRLAQEFEIPIAITGRWADTSAEKALREQAVEAMEALVAQGVDIDEAKRLIAAQFGMDAFQVKISGQSRTTDLDVFIPKDIWDKLPEDKKVSIGEKLRTLFDVHKVDFYQDIPLEKVPEGWPDPRWHLPRGAVLFNPNGTIVHDLLGK